MFRRLIFLSANRITSIYTRFMSESSTIPPKNVIIEKVGNVTTIGINRPEKRNCVNPSTAHELYKAFKDFENDDDARVAVLHGKGGSFCAGFDLKYLSTVNESVNESLQPGPDEAEEGIMGPSRMIVSKPVIAAVSGYAVAGGFELALMCDLRVVEESAIMGVFCRRFGVPLIDGGTVRLPQLIGLSRALDLILTGRAIDAKEALECGLANRVVSTGTALGQAVMLANSIAKFPQKCMNADRKSAYYSSYDAKSFIDALQYEYENGCNVLTEESIPGAQKFSGGIGRHGSFNLDKKSKL